MFEHCEVVTRKQILALAGAFAVLGWVAAGLVQTYALAETPPAREVRSVRILANSAIETVARIRRVRPDGRAEFCTLRIDHKTSSWSLAC